jgi:NAD(P)H-dependent FMN reductase
MAASPGALGGLRGLFQLRQLLSNIRVLVLPDQIAIAQAHEAFNTDGSLRDAAKQKTVEGIGAQVAQTAAKLRGA